jgi:ATP-dependent Clp protease adaptor protein ClpS
MTTTIKTTNSHNGFEFDVDVEFEFEGDIAERTDEFVTIDDSAKLPPLYRIIYLNDDVTTYEFVVHTLKEFFNHDDETAQELTDEVHSEGSSIVAVRPYEVAEQKGIEIMALAREQDYMLTIQLEPDD